MNYLVVKDGDLFALTDNLGNMSPESEKGLYTHDTRCLDKYELRVNNQELIPLYSSCEENYVSTIRLTNKNEVNDGTVQLQSEQLEVKREQLVQDGVFYEQITVFNYARTAIDISLDIRFGSQFVDLFEVRGQKRMARGRVLPPTVEPGKVVLAYEGLDKIARKAILRCSNARETREGLFVVSGMVDPGKSFVFELSVQTVIGDEPPGHITSFNESLSALKRDYADWQKQTVQVTTDSPSLNRLIARGLLDLQTLITDLGDGPFPVAGIPWFAVPFGRDSIIAALQMLWARPDVARGTLRTLARLQGTELNAWRVEEPGKIVHEVRRGEMANLDEVPFSRYYGSVDSTPLFLILAAEYFCATNDHGFIAEILPNLLRAIEWIQHYGDLDGDGFVEYHSPDSNGLSVQSWKDSYDSMIHCDGEIAQSPMAVSEVQGYVYQAKQSMAALLPKFGYAELALQLQTEANSLKEQFNNLFWMQDKQYAAIALDRDKRQVQTVTSDPGHCLWANILVEEHAEAVTDRLLEPDMFSGWGIRTMSADEFAYSPISYHDGSVWAHDNSMILLGFAKQGRADAVNRLTEALLRASEEFEYQRLPELFCGHSTEVGAVVQYPVACNPQAWAAGTPLVMLKAILGMEIDAQAKVVHLSPTWPAYVSTVTMQGLRVGDVTVSFTVDKFHGLTVDSDADVRIVMKEPARTTEADTHRV